jgi:hypothetical protein
MLRLDLIVLSRGRWLDTSRLGGCGGRLLGRRLLRSCLLRGLRCSCGLDRRLSRCRHACALERELLSDDPPLARNGALALLDRGDQLILAHFCDVGDAKLAGQLT